MLRFAYLTDTHLGCGLMGYFLQPRYLGREADLFAGLGRWLAEVGASFVVHGGDVTDHGLPQEIELARSHLASLGVPAYLCLGNHDLMQPGSAAAWRAASGLLPATDWDCYSVTTPDAVLVVVTHHWHPGVDHHWQADEAQLPRVDARQEAALRRLIGATSRPVIAITHAPLNDVPGVQRGDAAPFHPPYEPYLDTWRRLAADHPALRLVMCGHSHAHSHEDQGRFVSTTTAAFGEVPAQVRLVTVTSTAIEVQTVNLAAWLGWPVGLQPPRLWSAGPVDAPPVTVAL